MAEIPARAIGKYEILSEIGQGSMGTVYKARDPVLERVVALKTILPGAVLDAEARERFLREARSVARLQHPNIITIFEMGEMEQVPFIAMEFLEGESLADAAEIGRPAGVEAKLRVIEQLCRGLGYAHGRGVVHRDVKPTNIFLQPDGTAKLLDYLRHAYGHAARHPGLHGARAVQRRGGGPSGRHVGGRRHPVRDADR
jgi:serine/threonine protein kinase